MTRFRGWALALSVLAVTPSLACRDDAKPPSGAAFDGGRAFQHLRTLVDIGPRPAGSAGDAAARAYIESELRRSGVKVETSRFPFTSPEGAAFEGANVIGTLEGASPRTVAFLTHFDTKPSAQRRLVEANAAASGPALLLELARVAAAERRSRTIVFAFVDASQPFGDAISETDGLAGSRALALEWDRSGRLADLASLVLVESVADSDLQLANEAVTAPDERLLFARLVTAAGLSKSYDPYSTVRVHSDQDPFITRGVTRIFTILDPAHGGTIPPGELRGSVRDDISSVSEATLARVGDLGERLLRELLAAK